MSVVTLIYMSEDNSSLGLFLDKSLFLDQTDAINEPADPVYGWLNCVISVLNIVVNSWAIPVLRTKENELTSNLV